MIEKLITGSRVTEVGGTAKLIINAYNNTGLNNDPNMVKIFQPLQDKLSMHTEAINRIKIKSKQEVNDEIRCEKFSGLFYLLVGLTHHPDAQIKSAATDLLKIFQNYGLEIKKESYTTKSSLINSLLGDYSDPACQANIALLPQCAEYISALEAAQAAFDSTRLAYDQTRAGEKILFNASTLKKELLAIINGKLVPYIQAMEQIDNQVYGLFARTIAEMIGENNEVVKRRVKRSDKEQATVE